MAAVGPAPALYCERSHLIGSAASIGDRTAANDAAAIPSAATEAIRLFVIIENSSDFSASSALIRTENANQFARCEPAAPTWHNRTSGRTQTWPRSGRC